MPSSTWTFGSPWLMTVMSSRDDHRKRHVAMIMLDKNSFRIEAPMLSETRETWRRRVFKGTMKATDGNGRIANGRDNGRLQAMRLSGCNEVGKVVTRRFGRWATRPSFSKSSKYHGLSGCEVEGKIWGMTILTIERTQPERVRLVNEAVVKAMEKCRTTLKTNAFQEVEEAMGSWSGEEEVAGVGSVVVACPSRRARPRMDTLTLAADKAHCVRPTGRAMCAEIQGQRPIRDGFSTGDVALQAGSRGLLRGGWRMARFDWTGRSALRDGLGGHQRAPGATGCCFGLRATTPTL